MSRDLGLIAKAAAENINSPASNQQIIIFKDAGNGLYYGKNSAGVVELISAPGYGQSIISVTAFNEVAGDFALPFTLPVAEDEVVNILTQLKAVSTNGKIYSTCFTRTVVGIGGLPAGMIAPVGNMVFLTDPPQTSGSPTFEVNEVQTNLTGFIYFTSVTGDGIITVTIKESYI